MVVIMNRMNDNTRCAEPRVISVQLLLTEKRLSRTIVSIAIKTETMRTMNDGRRFMHIRYLLQSFGGVRLSDGDKPMMKKTVWVLVNTDFRDIATSYQLEY